MTKDNNEVKVTFKAFNQEFNKGIAEMNKESTKLRQEMKLQSEQMKYTATESDKLKATISGLEKQYEIAQRKTSETAKALENAKKQWGENSTEAQKFETQLRRNEIAEQQIANNITRTTESLGKAVAAEKERTAASSDAAKKLEELKSSEDKLTQSSEKLNAQYELQKAQLGATATESQKLTAKMEHLNGAHDVAGQKVKVYEEQLEQAKKQYGESSSEVQGYEQKLLEARTAEQQLANEIVTTNDTLTRQNDVLRQTSERLQETGDKMKKIGKQVTTKVSAPIALAGAGMIKFASDQQAAFAQTSTLLEGSEKDLKAYKDSVRDLSSAMGVSFEEVAVSVYSSLSAGQSQADAIAFTEQAMKLAGGGFTDTATAVDILTTALNAYGLESDKTTGISDMLIKTQDLGKTTVGELGASMGKIIPIAEGQNVAFDQLATSYAVLTKNGQKTKEAGTNLKAMLGELGKAGSKTDKILREETGKSFSDLSAEGETLNDVLQILQQDAENSGLKLSDLFGSMQAGTAALTLAKNEGEEYNDFLKKMGESAGATEKNFSIMTATLQDKMNIAKESVKNAMAEMGEIILPVVIVIADAIAKIASAFGNIPVPIQIVIIAVGALLAVLGPIIWLIGTLLSSWGAITAALVKFPAIASLVTGAMTAIKVAIASISWPITLLIAAIALAVFLIVKYWDEIKAATVAVFNFIVDFLKEWGVTILVVLSGPIGWITAFIIKNWEDVKRWTIEIFTAISQFFEDIFNAIGKFLSTVVESIVNFVVSKWENLSDETRAKLIAVYEAIIKVWTAISLFFSTIMEKIIGTVKEKFQKVVDAVRDKMQAAKDFVSNILTEIFDYMMQFSLFRAGIELIQSFIDGIKSMFSTIIRVVGEIIDTIPDTIKKVLGIDGSDSKMKKAGKKAGDDFADGMKSSKDNVKKSAKELAKEAEKEASKSKGKKDEKKDGNKKNEKVSDKDKKKADADAKKEKKKADADAKKQATAAAKAERDAVNKAMTDINAQISSSRASGKSSAGSEAEVWKNNIGQFKAGSKERIKAENAYAAARDKQAKEQQAQQKKQQSEKDKQNKASVAAQKKADKDKLSAKKKHDADAKKQTQAAAKAERDAQTDTLQKVNVEIAERRANGGLSSTEEAAIWKTAIGKFKEGSKERIKAQNEYTAAMKKIDKEQEDAIKDKYDAIKQVADDKKSMDQLSLKDEADYWKKAVQQFKKGTKERISAQKEYQRTLKQINDNVVGINKKYADQMKQISDKLVSDRKDENNKYDIEFKSRRDSYLGFAGLFDEFEIKMGKTGEELLNNLNNQVDGFKQWQKEMEKLEYKGVDKALVEELRQLGPKALPELMALNDLTASELNKYSNLFKEKSALATSQAENELSGLKKSTKDSIEAMTDVANKELSNLETEWVNELKKVTSAADDELQGMQQIGKDAGQSLLDGLIGMEGSLVSGAVQIAQNVNAALRNTLGLDDLTSNLSVAVNQAAKRQPAVPESNASIYQRMQGSSQAPAPITEVTEVSIIMDGTVIREEADIKKLARELFVLQDQARRGRGRG